MNFATIKKNLWLWYFLNSLANTRCGQKLISDTASASFISYCLYLFYMSTEDFDVLIVICAITEFNCHSMKCDSCHRRAIDQKCSCILEFQCCRLMSRMPSLHWLLFTVCLVDCWYWWFWPLFWVLCQTHHAAERNIWGVTATEKNWSHASSRRENCS